MGNFQPSFDNTESFIAEWHDCYVSDSKITGFVCTFQLKDKKHHFYGLNDLPHLLKEAKRRKKDVYLSLNAFEYGLRQTDHLKQIRNVGVDVDCYKLKIPISTALDKIKIMILKGTIPNPNLVIFSGRGIQLLYSISGGASPKMAFLSQYITTQFIAELRHLGADTSATDVTRVFRLPYSINSKSDKQVTLEIWRTLEYSLEELYSFCRPLEERRKRKKGTLYTIPSKPGLKNLYSLNTARKNDLEALVSLRMGQIEFRNVLTYIYAYTVALLLKNKQATLEFTQQLNDRFDDPQKVKEVMRTAGNAYDDAMKFFEEFKKRDFKMWYRQNDGIKRPMKNDTIIDGLGISPYEMGQLTTIIDDSTKKARNTIKKRKKRREEGVMKREEYLEQAKEKTDDKLWQLQKVMERHPTANKTELAEMIGISRNHLYRLLKKLKV
jgi:DNA-binding phage protein